MSWVVIETRSDGQQRKLCTMCTAETHWIKPDAKIFHQCRATGWKRTTQFLKDLSKWIKAGFPVRSQSAALAIYNDHCLPCDARIEVNGVEQCKDCGCPLKQKASLVSKLRWETSHCPRKKW